MVPYLALDQRSGEWFEARRGRITASLAAACLGLDPHTGPLAAYNRIMGLTGGDDNKHTRWGNEFEAVARDHYEVESGHIVQPCGFFIHEHFDWLGASPDGLVAPNGLVEIKCPGTVPPDIPLHHIIQMWVQMACSGRWWCDYFSWNQNGHLLLKVCRDLVHEDELLGKLEEFYLEHLKPGVPPKRGPRLKVSK